jgi:mono/diheme cytochrome c family protein
VRRPARVTAAAFSVQCPACHADIPNPSDGSFLWSAEELGKAQQMRDEHHCGCGGIWMFKLPARLASR